MTITMSVPKGSNPMTENSEARKISVELVGLLKAMGDKVERLVEHLDCEVSLTVYFNEGSESMKLHQINGEFDLEVKRVIRLDPKS